MDFELSAELLAGWKILVVDDEQDSLEVAQTLLSVCGAQVLTASDGLEGFNLAVEHRPRFIISDLSMPGMSGWELIHKLKANPATKDIPVIALTAHAMKGDREMAISAGFHNHFSKPLHPASFVNDLLNLLIDIPEFKAALVSKD